MKYYGECIFSQSEILNFQNFLGEHAPIPPRKAKKIFLTTVWLDKFFKPACPRGGELPYVRYTGMCHRPGSSFHFQKSRTGPKFLNFTPEQALLFEGLLQNRPYFLKIYSRTGSFFDNLVSNGQLKCLNPSCFQVLFSAA